MKTNKKHPGPGYASLATHSDAVLLIHVSEAARMCGISRSLGYGLVASGTWPSIRIGRAVRVPVAALTKWIEDNQN